MLSRLLFLGCCYIVATPLVWGLTGHSKDGVTTVAVIYLALVAFVVGHAIGQRKRPTRAKHVPARS